MSTRDVPETEEPSAEAARRIAAKALSYACLRFPESAEIQRLLTDAVLTDSRDLSAPIQIVRPSGPNGIATIRFDRDQIAALQREHRYPEWVLCATIERTVLSQFPQWGLPEPEVERLVAHRERIRRPRPSESGPSSQP